MIVKGRSARPGRLKLKFRKGYLSEVVNPAGKKASVYIYQGRKKGFSAAYAKSHKKIKGSNSNAEAYAKMLARKGHKKVTFKD